MRPPISETPVSSRPHTITISADAPFRFVCAALALSLALLIFRIAGQL